MFPSVIFLCHSCLKPDESNMLETWSRNKQVSESFQLLFKFWLPSGYILTIFWLHSDYSLTVTTFWLHSDWLTDCYIYLRGSCSKTILEFFLHCLTASIEQWKCVCSCQLCFMHWSCSSFVTNLLCCMHWSRRRWRTCGFRVPVVRDGRKWTEGRR